MPAQRTADWWFRGSRHRRCGGPLTDRRPCALLPNRPPRLAASDHLDPRAAHAHTISLRASFASPVVSAADVSPIAMDNTHHTTPSRAMCA